MKYRIIIYGLFILLLVAALDSCYIDERTNPNDPKSGDYIMPPKGTFVINGGAAAVNATDVILNINLPGAAEMRFGNSVNGLNASYWTAYSDEFEWIIEGSSNGEKKVLGEFRNSPGDIIRVSDSIIFDDIPPEVDTTYPLTVS